MFKYISGKFKKGFTILEILSAIALLSVLIIYSGFEYRRVRNENIATRMAAHAGYIVSALERYYNAKNIQGATNIFNGVDLNALCNGNHLAPGICTGSGTLNTFAGITGTATYLAAANVDQDLADVTFRIHGTTNDQAVATRLADIINVSSTPGLGTASPADTGNDTGWQVTATYTPGSI